ncbi:hypothetical protein [Streptomyces violaceusniger]|uniref:hypothetical protein n=1 Tax=Streptomyces violaceusniger TaxID=68280 RepID=UPI0037FA75E5
MGLASGLTRGATLADRRPFAANKPAPPHPPIEVATRLDLDRLLKCFVAGSGPRAPHRDSRGS